MTHSLRIRVLLLVFLLNALVFGASGVFVLRTLLQEYELAENETTEDLVATIRDTIRPEQVNLRSILEWRSWGFFEDALIVERGKRGLTVSEAGRITAEGLELNPLGIQERRVDFDHQAALAGIKLALDSLEPVEEVENGRVLPIAGPDGESWGGLWYRTADRVDEGGLVRGLLPWFALSTLLLTLVTFFAMRRMVLDPVEMLAEGARRVRGGDFSVRLPESKSRDEITDLVRSFNEMTSTVGGFNERLAEEALAATDKARQAEAAAMTQRRLAAMGELAAGLAHEINNPLGGLQNAVTTLEREDLPAAKREQYLKLLATGLERIGETVNRLRRFTPREAQSERVDLSAVARDAIELVQHRAERLGVEIDCVEIGRDSAEKRLRGARNDIGQAVLNLLANSLDALEESGSKDEAGARIDVRIQRMDDGVSFTVRDNGPGVDPDELAQVSDLFYTTKEVGKGTGLGLALVHNALARHSGNVWIKSERGKFFEVELWFPLQKSGGGEA